MISKLASERQQKSQRRHSQSSLLGFFPAPRDAKSWIKTRNDIKPPVSKDSIKKNKDSWSITTLRPRCSWCWPRWPGTPKQQQLRFGKRRTWGMKNHHFSWQSLCRKRSIASSTSYPRPHQLEKRRGPNGKGFVLLCEDYFFKNVGMNIISACRILPFTLWC